VGKCNVSQRFQYQRVSFDGTILFIHCHKLYVLHKNLYISQVEEKLKFPLICTVWYQFEWSGFLHLATERCSKRKFDWNRFGFSEIFRFDWFFRHCVFVSFRLVSTSWM